jgi:hypothetical protein
VPHRDWVSLSGGPFSSVKWLRTLVVRQHSLR